MKKKFLYIGAMALLLGTSGCEKFGEFGDTNTDPDAVYTPVTASILANALNSSRGQAFQTTPGYYAQYFSETQYPGNSLYGTVRSAFNGTYAGVMYDLKKIQEFPDATNNQKLVARMLLQYYYWNLTDLFGDLPYSEAMQGEMFSSPKYDTQEEIYRGILTELSSLSAQFDSSLINGDLIYSANPAKWKKLNNSLRMMVAIQLSKRFPTSAGYAATQFRAALNDPAGSMETNADNWQIKVAANFSNSYWAEYNGRRDLAVSDTYVDLLKARGDQRLKAHAGGSEVAGSTSTSEKGFPYGRTRNYVVNWTNSNPDWARVLRGDLRTETGVQYILTAGQSLLVRAEAANLGWTTENASALYAAGILQSHLQWGRTAAEATAYLANANVALGTDNVKKIAEQQYIAFFPDGLRAWNIWRRTGYPTLVPAIDYTSATRVIPQRYMYADAEGTSNKTGYDAAIAKLPGGVDSQLHKVWWAQ